MAGSSRDAPRPPMMAQNTMTAVRLWDSAMARAPIAYASRPSTYARLRPIRSPTLLPIRMNAAETRASRAIADCTPLAVVSRSRTTAEIDTFMIDVSTTRTNIAIASRIARRRSPLDSSTTSTGASIAPTARSASLRRAPAASSDVGEIRLSPSDVDVELAEIEQGLPAPAGRVGGERQREGHAVRLAERLAVAQDLVVAGRRLDGEAGGFEPADELANVLPHRRL